MISCRGGLKFQAQYMHFMRSRLQQNLRKLLVSFTSFVWWSEFNYRYKSFSLIIYGVQDMFCRFKLKVMFTITELRHVEKLQNYDFLNVSWMLMAYVLRFRKVLNFSLLLLCNFFHLVPKRSCLCLWYRCVWRWNTNCIQRSTFFGANGTSVNKNCYISPG